MFLLSRRALLLAAASPTVAEQASASPAAVSKPPSPAERAAGTLGAADSPLVARLLESTKLNKAKYDAERAASYDKRNFGDYMSYELGVSGSMRGMKPVSCLISRRKSGKHTLLILDPTFHTHTHTHRRRGPPSRRG